MTHPRTPGTVTRRRIAVLASGGGSNLDALMSYLSAQEEPPAAVILALSDRSDAGALRRAAAAGATVATLTRPSDGALLQALLDQHGIDLVVLAGYLKLVPVPVVRRFHGTMVNIHPALLPLRGGPGMYGIRAHRAVLASGDRVSGATVHFVNAEYDRGAPIAWATVPVAASDSPESLAARVLVAEHYLLPRVVDGLARGTIRLGDRAVEVAAEAEALFTSPPAGVSVQLADHAAPHPSPATHRHA